MQAATGDRQRGAATGAVLGHGVVGRLKLRGSWAVTSCRLQEKPSRRGTRGQLVEVSVEVQLAQSLGWRLGTETSKAAAVGGTRLRHPRKARQSQRPHP